MKTGILYISVIIVLALTPCHDFLTKYPKDTVYPTSTDDFNELLIGDGYLSGPTRWDIGKWLNLMDDDVEYTRHEFHATVPEILQLGSEPGL